MRFTNIVAFLIVMSLFTFVFSGCVKNLHEISRRKNRIKKEFESARFMSESFRNTCRNKGFENLIEWQKVCKAMWQLDYIGWTEADSFMEVIEKENSQLLYGKWTGPFGSGEVYERKLSEKGRF